MPPENVPWPDKTIQIPVSCLAVQTYWPPFSDHSNGYAVFVLITVGIKPARDLTGSSRSYSDIRILYVQFYINMGLLSMHFLFFSIPALYCRRTATVDLPAFYDTVSPDFVITCVSITS